MRALDAAGLRDPHLLVATWFGAGLLRPGPGTWGSALAAGQALLICLLFEAATAAWIIRGLCLLTILLGFWAVPRAAAVTGLHDPGAVVIDEAAGVFLALSLFPAVYLAHNPFGAVVASMLLFRVFDIAKPPPVATVEGLPGALGVMGDDLLAGVLAGVCAFAFVP
ncbi:MAG: phosphatidylglycerophosphatase A [Planctomycetota bacterium]